MRKTKTISKEVTERILESITCNKCGTERKMEYDFTYNEFQHVNFSFGYGSKFDNDNWSFDLCENCVEELVKSLQHVPNGIDSHESDGIMSQDEFECWKTDSLKPYSGVWSEDDDYEEEED